MVFNVVVLYKPYVAVRLHKNQSVAVFSPVSRKDVKKYLVRPYNNIILTETM